MTLALLLTAATGAWAQSTFQVKELTADMVSGWSATDNTPFELSDLPGFVQFISLDEAKAWADIPSSGRVSLIYKFEDGKFSCVEFVNGQLDDPATSTLTAHKAAYNRIHGSAGPDWTFKIYYTTATDFPITWDATAKTASIAAMPAGNVTVNVKYYPQATADGAVTATTGAIATTDAPLVTIDTDMLTGADGMKYYVSETNTAPDYTTDGWTTDVPNAKNYTEAKTLYLWYYPLGRVGQTADDIYSDGNMNDEPLVLSVAPLPTYDIAIGAGNFATFYDLFNVMLDPQTPEGVGLYTITSIDDQRTKATLAPLTGIVPSGTPMIIYNGTGSEQSVKLKATTDEANGIYPVFIDQFMGASTDVWFDENAMANNDFYLLSGGKAFAPVLGPGTLKAHQCCLRFPKQSGARTIQLVFEDATGITTVSGSPADAPLYDLNGRRVTKPAKKGVYIQNGRKVVR